MAEDAMAEHALNTVRTLLFVPGNRPDRFGKAETSGADGAILDLEDAVSPAHKDAAREIAVTYLQTTPPREGVLRCLRINSLGTPAGLKDVAALVDRGVRPQVLVVPKAEDPGEFARVERMLAPHPVPCAAIVETAAGLGRAEAIARAPGIAALSFGGADLAVDLGAALAWEPMLVPRCLVVHAAAAARIAAWDMPYFGLNDPDDSALADEARRVRDLGFTGKLAIHPKHVGPIIRVFTPGPDEVARAARVVEAFEQAAGDACEVDGRMIDIPIYRAAQRVLALAGRRAPSG